ncbi:hypothetical protein [Streptomyces nigra]|uniref:hypothetical protein n=1 Tax=Streptomyces nigra TaxID=1827580 RepID=UPI0030CA8E44
MTTSREPVQGPPPAVIAAGGVFLPAHLAYPLWHVLRAHVDRHRTEGGAVRPDVAAALDALRAAALAHMSANGHDARTPADIAAQSAPDRLVTTEALAGRLGVTGRHVRRLAVAEGITPAARGLWEPDDADYLASLRKGRR